jgi:hypothetical protein
MALKKLVDVGETFPVKRPRLGAAPPPADVLNNVGAPDLAPPAPVAANDALNAYPVPQAAVAPPVIAPASRDGSDGRGIHTGKGIDARRQKKTGRDYQFGARTTVAFADELKRIAASKGITIGGLLEDMLEAYKGSKA